MNERELEHFYITERGMSRSAAKKAVSDAKAAGLVEKYRPPLFTRICNALQGKNRPAKAN